MFDIIVKLLYGRPALMSWRLLWLPVAVFVTICSQFNGFSLMRCTVTINMMTMMMIGQLC